RPRHGRALFMTIHSRPTDLFGQPTLVGLNVVLDGSPGWCDGATATLFPGRAMHAGELVCTKCGQHRGWLSKQTHEWLLKVVGQFGRPEKPIVIRDREKQP